MDGWIKLSEKSGRAVKYVNRRNIVSVSDMGGGVIATMWNGDTVRMEKLPPDKPTAKSYIQNGLVAMWDGIENAGWGTHNSAATTWKDLIGSRDWTLGASSSYEWTANSFDAKNQFAATQKFISASAVGTLEFCAKIKAGDTTAGNYAYIIIGRMSSSDAPYFGLLYRNNTATSDGALMGGLAYYRNTVPEFNQVGATFSFSNYQTIDAPAYFNGVSRPASGSNTLDYNATTRGTVARIGGTAQQPMPIEVYNIRLYSRALTADEIAHNYEIDKKRFNLP